MRSEPYQQFFYITNELLESEPRDFPAASAYAAGGDDGFTAISGFRIRISTGGGDFTDV